MSNQRALTNDEKVELKALNAAVKAAVKARSAWLDAKMHETSELQVGDDIYNVDTGVCLGKIVELYRFWADRDDGIRDTSVECHYKYETGRLCYDNTSRQSGVSFGTREDAARIAELRASRLRLP